MHTSEGLSPLTFGNEDTLPRVPLPTLEETCERFLQWCAPLLTDYELAATERAVAEFRAPGSPAHALHAALESYDNMPGVHSWLDEFWRDRYLGRRDRIALNANFFFLFNDTGEGQVDRAAGLVLAALDHKTTIDEERLPPVLRRGQPLSMEQNKYLFSATRIPHPVRDTARLPYSDERPGPSRARHIVVFRHGHAFRLDVVGADGRPHTLQEVREALRAIMEAGAQPAEPGTSVGHLTTKARAEWAESKQTLIGLDPANEQAVDDIESALFCLALDDVVPGSAREACDHLLHGDSANRWFDKAITLIVFGDGTAGLNGEHCKLDGTTVVAFVDAMLSASSEEHERAVGAVAQGAPAWATLEFVLDDSLRADIAKAGQEFADYAAHQGTATVSIEGFTSERAKELKCSPDAFAQLSFQLAHQRAKGHIGATYESIATRHFRHGRTEAMRVVTPEIARFVAAMDDPDADADARRATFQAAAAKHVARAKECQQGQAPEQHLWELQLVQRRHGEDLDATDPLAIYDSPGWLTMRDDYLSTSAVPSPHVRFFGFGSTSPKCIGVGYALLPDRFDLYLCTPKSVAEQMTVFADRLAEAVRELDALLARQDG